MKKDLCIKIISLMLLPLLLFSGCSGKGKVPLAKAVAPAGFIHAEGKHLVLGEEHIMLKGVNAGGWLLTEDWLTPTSLDGDLSSEQTLPPSALIPFACPSGGAISWRRAAR